MKDLTKEEILGKYYFPKGFIKLNPTNHCIERLNERGYGLDFLPSVVRITESNLYSGKTSNNRSLCSVVVKLEYTPKKHLFLCINPFDGAVKTVWYGDRSQQQNRKKGSKRTV